MGTNKSIHREEGTDITAVNDGYISITPLRYDLTDHGLYKKIEEWDWSDVRIFKIQVFTRSLKGAIKALTYLSLNFIMLKL